MQVYLHAGVLAYVIELIAVASAPVPRQPSLEMCWLREESTLTRRFHAPREDPQKRADSILRLPPYAHAKALFIPLSSIEYFRNYMERVLDEEVYEAAAVLREVRCPIPLVTGTHDAAVTHVWRVTCCLPMVTM